MLGGHPGQDLGLEVGEFGDGLLAVDEAQRGELRLDPVQSGGVAGCVDQFDVVIGAPSGDLGLAVRDVVVADQVELPGREAAAELFAEVRNCGQRFRHDSRVDLAILTRRCAWSGSSAVCLGMPRFGPTVEGQVSTADPQPPPVDQCPSWCMSVAMSNGSAPTQERSSSWASTAEASARTFCMCGAFRCAAIASPDV